MPHLDEIPMTLVGKGEQSSVKIKLALDVADGSHVFLIEEAENHLSFTNLASLIAHIAAKRGDRQLLITTHSSYVMNKLGVDSVLMFMNGIATKLTSLDPKTRDYFLKLPGYDTLRLVLSKRAILVEGPSDELIVQKAYHRAHGKMPIEGGVDVISVSSLAFKRFLEIADILNIKVDVVTDNDGDVARLQQKYADYLKHKHIAVQYDLDESARTLEPQLLKANGRVVLNDILGTTYNTDEDLLKFMQSNKTEVALRLFETDKAWNVPEYIHVRSPNRIVIAAAGGGKTTRIVDEVLADKSVRSAIITYTRNNVREIQAKFYQRGQAIPQHVEIIPWYTFLLREMARPYRNHKYDKRIDGIFWTETTVDRFAPKSDVGRYYFGNSSNIYSNKLAEFVCDCNAMSDNAIMRRMEQRFERVYIDEIQDFAGYDLDILELMLRSNVEVVLVGDPRQSTFTTNNSNRHRGFRGPDIIKKFQEWEKKKLVEPQHLVETHRCNQLIANLADSFYPEHEKTKSRNEDVTGHDGVFSIKTEQVNEYITTFGPQVLRLSVKNGMRWFSGPELWRVEGYDFRPDTNIPAQEGAEMAEDRRL